jgi:uncharacterized protein (DUF1697 family)
MIVWVALLRGVNVGGKNLLPMRDLARDLEDIGCQSVTTYIQSGNVVFSMSGVKAPQLAERIGQTILDRHGFQPQVHLLTVNDLEKAVSLNPFPDASADPKTLHLAFLSEKPAPAKLRSLDTVKAASERYSLVGKFLYVHTPEGVGRSKLAASLERLLGVSATARNWRTVNKLLALAQEIT